MQQQLLPWLLPRQAISSCLQALSTAHCWLLTFSTCSCQPRQHFWHCGTAHLTLQTTISWVCWCWSVQDKSSDELRAAAAGLLAAICRAGGAVLWSAGGFYAEEALRLAVGALDDAATVRQGTE
jgi:hypothetical protein